MSRMIDSIYKVNNNPFIFAPLVMEFYKFTESRPKDILLSYLILPLVLYETSKNSLNYSNTNSSISTFSRKKENLYGLGSRLNKYKDITNKCIQYLIDNKYLYLDENLSVKIVNSDKKLYCVTSLGSELKSSGKLNKVFKDYSVVEIYKLLGIKEL